MIINNKSIFLGVILGFSVLAGCKTNGDVTEKSDYDRRAMLANYADNLIVPGFQKLKSETDEMAAALSAFAASPTTATLGSARKEYLEAYLALQDVSAFEFGPADDQMLRNSLNIFPTTVSQIESNIASGSDNLETTANLSAKGFSALDYLLYGTENEAAVLQSFTTAQRAANRKSYLLDLSARIKQTVDATVTGWTSGSYLSTFKETLGTAVGSSTGNLVNQFNFDADVTKRAKVGIPVGKYSANNPLPDRVEAYYSKNSLLLLERNVRAHKAIFKGQSAAGADGPGLDDYLNHVGAKPGGVNLSETIIKQYDAALAAIAAVPASFQVAVTSHPAAVAKVHEELQKLIILTKTDMPSALGVSITYTDNDGD